MGGAMFAILGAARPAAAQGAPPQGPPSTGTDMEIDPDAPPPEPEPPPPLPEAPPGTWGVGGTEDEGRFAPKGKTGALKEQEEAAKEDADDSAPVDLGPPGAATVDTVIGFGEMRDVVADALGAGAPASVTSISLIAGLSYRFAKIWTVGARLPYTFATINVPRSDRSADEYNTGAIGNLELSVRPSFQITRRLRVPAQLAISFPTAPGDLLGDNSSESNVKRAEALISQSAMFSRGWEENPLFAWSRVSLSPGTGITYDRGPLHVAAHTRLDLMFQSGGEEPGANENQPPDPDLRDPAITWLLGGSFGYDLLDGMITPGLRAWLAYSSQPLRVRDIDYSGIQLVAEPELNGRFPVGPVTLRGGAGVIVPVSGHLGGADAASLVGMRVKLGVLF